MNSRTSVMAAYLLGKAQGERFNGGVSTILTSPETIGVIVQDEEK